MLRHLVAVGDDVSSGFQPIDDGGAQGHSEQLCLFQGFVSLLNVLVHPVDGGLLVG